MAENHLNSDQAPFSPGYSTGSNSSNGGVPATRASGARVIPDIVVDGGRLAETWVLQSEQPKIAIAVDPIALITTECITVTSAMRKHARWAQSSVAAILGGSSATYRHAPASPKASAIPVRRQSGSISSIDIPSTNEDDTLTSRWGLRGKKGRSLQDNPLMSAFARLRNDLRGCTGKGSLLRTYN